MSKIIVLIFHKEGMKDEYRVKNLITSLRENGYDEKNIHTLSKFDNQSLLDALYNEHNDHYDRTLYIIIKDSINTLFTSKAENLKDKFNNCYANDSIIISKKKGNNDIDDIDLMIGYKRNLIEFFKLNKSNLQEDNCSIIAKIGNNRYYDLYHYYDATRFWKINKDKSIVNLETGEKPILLSFIDNDQPNYHYFFEMMYGHLDHYKAKYYSNVMKKFWYIFVLLLIFLIFIVSIFVLWKEKKDKNINNNTSFIEESNKEI